MNTTLRMYTCDTKLMYAFAEIHYPLTCSWSVVSVPDPMQLISNLGPRPKTNPCVNRFQYCTYWKQYTRQIRSGDETSWPPDVHCVWHSSLYVPSLLLRLLTFVTCSFKFFCKEQTVVRESCFLMTILCARGDCTSLLRHSAITFCPAQGNPGMMT